jgi:hypothetical protein
MQPFGSLDPLTGGLFYFLSILFALFMIVALPILVVTAIRFFWYRHVYVGRSAELDKLVWQLHRIASALEQHQVAPPNGTLAEPAQPHGVALSMFGR